MRSRVGAYALARERRRPLIHALLLAGVLFAAFASLFLSRSFTFEANANVPITGLSLPSIGAAPAEDPVLVVGALPDTVRREEVAPALEALAAGTSDVAGATDAPAAVSGEAAGAAVEAAVVTEPFVLYSVQSGDSASAIAAAHGVDLQYLLWANPDLRDGELLRVGQLLVIPAGNGIIYHVRHGDTLSDIAARYSVAVDDILGWAGNGIASADQVIEDATLYLPGAIAPASILPAEAPPAAEDPPAAVAAPPPPPVATVEPGPVSSVGLAWPVFGPISSYMDYSHPLGIDIDLYNNVGAPIGAATGGTVTFAGGDPCCSYGLYVVVMSPGGIETLYAHFSSIAVSPGQTVTPGQALGYAGCTGYCTGTHLHFEVIDNGVRVNPLSYLP